MIPERAELLSDVQVPQVRVVAQTVEIPQSLFGEKIAAIPEVLFHAGMKRTMKRIAQQPSIFSSTFVLWECGVVCCCVLLCVVVC